MRRRSSEIANVVTVLAALYVLTAYVVFSFRHPWATRTEAMLHSWSVLTFQAVPYEAMRPREVR